MAPHKTELPFDGMFEIRMGLRRTYEFPENLADGVATAVNNASQMVLDRMDERFDDVDRRFDDVDRRFENVDKRFDDVDQRFDDVNKRFECVDKQILCLDKRTIKLATSNRISILTMIGTAIAAVTSVALAVIELFV